MKRKLRLGLLGVGRMGRAVESIAAARGHELAWRVDRTGQGSESFRSDPVDVVIDFSSHEAAARYIPLWLQQGARVVSGTTGWDSELASCHVLARTQGALLWAPNFSIGMATLARVAQLAATICTRAGGFDLYVAEQHHHAKRDAPSGSAKLLVRILEEVLNQAPHEHVAQVPVTSLRVGSIPGTHTVGFEAAGESLELTHRVRDRTVFASGAVIAAEWLADKSGSFGWEEWIDSQLTSQASDSRGEPSGERS
jgi:4-hydroxy-tetrahydrodipicolinate reductase